MELQRKIGYYREYLKIYGSLIYDLSESERCIIRLIENDRLDDIEAVLRERIEFFL